MDATGQQMVLAAERRRQVQAERIQRAIRQMATGEYGYCAVGGERIPEARVETDPAAHLCVKCAAARP
jgi:DnaK suppressor protein